MYQQCTSAVRAGRFRDALRLIERDPRSQESLIVRLEIDYFMGNLEAAAQGAERLVRTSLDAPLRSRSISVLAAVKWDLGDLHESLVLSSRAFDLAREAGDLALGCKTAV